MKDRGKIISHSILFIAGAMAFGLPLWAAANWGILLTDKDYFYHMYPFLLEAMQKDRSLYYISIMALHFAFLFLVLILTFLLVKEGDTQRYESEENACFLHLSVWLYFILEGLFLGFLAVFSVFYDVLSPLLWFVAFLVTGGFLFWVVAKNVFEKAWL